jgi:hypothetical protein
MALNATIYKGNDKVVKLNALRKELNGFKKSSNSVTQLLPGIWISEQAEALIIKNK